MHNPLAQLGFEKAATPSPSFTTVRDLAASFRAREALQNPDLDVPLASLAMTTRGTVVVPRLGELSLTPWARSQLGIRLGVRFERWFSNCLPEELATEMTRRFARATDEVRLRTSRPEDGRVDGLLEGFVSKSYVAIADSRVAELLSGALSEIEPPPRVVRHVATDRTTSFVIGVGRPLHLGGPGNVGECSGAILVRNSGVGYASLWIVLQLYRKICGDGLVVPIPSAELVRQSHKRFDEERMKTALRDGLRRLPERLHRGARLLEEAAHHPVRQIGQEVRDVLAEAGLPLRLLPTILTAYAREEHASAFGISQALTLAAQHVSAEERVSLEAAAGRYLRRFEPPGREAEESPS
jgi:hypothetical protein